MLVKQGEKDTSNRILELVAEEIQSKRPRAGTPDKTGEQLGEENQPAWVDQSKRVKKAKTVETASKEKKVDRLACLKCGKNHVGDCLKGTRVCYFCKKRGHVAKNCPKKTEAGAKVAARVYTVTQENANQENATVLRGNFLIQGSIAYTLIDSGVTHSFISRSWLSGLRILPDTLANVYEVTLLSGDIMMYRDIVRGCELMVGDPKKITTDLVALSMKDFDVILGTNGLIKYGTRIDCSARIVTFQPPQEELI